MTVAFDFDGTILDSEPVKLAAFASLFEGLPEHEEIVAYNAQHRGISRRDKLEFIYNEILNVADVELAVESCLERYSVLLETGLHRCGLVRGFSGFAMKMRSTDIALAIVSSAPRDEILRRLSEQNLDNLFDPIYAYPTSKVSALAKIRSSDPSLVFFGDAMADYEAAQSNEVGFIGVASATNPNAFRGLEIPVIPDFRDIKRIQELLAAHHV